MITVKVKNEKEYLNCKQNFIINYVGLEEEINENIVNQYPHVKKEYLKYLRYCNKMNYNIVGTIQYIPVDTWALILCDTIKNETITAYDNNYQYIVNVFVPDNKINYKTLRKAFKGIGMLALELNASISIPWNKKLYKKITNVKELQSICSEIFEKKLDVEIINLEVN